VQTVNVHRVGSLYYVPATISRLGADPTEVLAAAGLEPTALSDPESTIPYARVGPLLQIASQMTRCPHFGLEVAVGLGLGVLGPIGEWMRFAPTLGDALLDIARLYHRNSRGALVYFLPSGDHAYWGYAIYHLGIEGSVHITDVAMLTGVNILVELIGRDNMASVKLLLARSEPDDPTIYQRFMGLSPVFNSDQSAFVLPRKLLDTPLPDADAAKRKEWQQRVQARWGAGDDDVATQVRRAIRVALLAGNVTSDDICTEVGMTERTMQRRLDPAGLSFQRILNETRYEVCRQLLLHTRLGIAEVSSIIGFADASVLTRRFFEWSGMTPSEWRTAHAASRTEEAMDNSPVILPVG
jgi:AraC-like DNA-binding protein